MDKLREAARQALEALREYRDTQMISAPRKAIEALREALEQPVTDTELINANCRYTTPLMNEQPVRQEPVGYEYAEQLAKERYKVVPSHPSMFHGFAVTAGDGERHLYVSRKADCENVARALTGAFLDGAYAATQRHTAPQTVSIQNESETDSSSSLMRTTVKEVELTDDDIADIARVIRNGQGDLYMRDFARAVIAADREKNNANNNS